MGMTKKNEKKLYNLFHGNVSEKYSEWASPDLIISDGAYGVRGFNGDVTDVSDLNECISPIFWNGLKKLNLPLVYGFGILK